MEFIEIISIAGSAIEAVGVFVVIVGSSISSAKFVSTFSKLPEGLLTALIGVSCGVQSYWTRIFNSRRYRQNCVVADTFENVAVLGIIILIRTFLSMALHLEVEGRWPWEKETS